MLSQHVLNNYDKFVNGINDIADIEKELQVKAAV